MALAALAACGGASPSELLTGPYGADASGSSSGSQGSSSGDDGGGDRRRDGASGSSSGATDDDSGSGGRHDGGGDDGPSGDERIEAGPTGPTILCPMSGSGSRCAAGDFCCVTGDAQSGTQTHECKAETQSCAGVPVRCAVPADCPNAEICCGTQQDNGGQYTYTEIACTKTCGGSLQRTFCRAGADCPLTAPTCGPSTLLPGYMVCQ